MVDESNNDVKKRQTIKSWNRPDGPLNIWRIIEGEEHQNDGTKKKIKFSIQDIPEEHYQDVIKHMCDYFVADEVTCQCSKIKDDEEALNDFRILWDYLLKIGISVAAYKLDSNNQIQELAGVNILFPVTDEIEEAIENFMKNFKSQGSRKIFEFMHDLNEKAPDVRDIYKVDTYISALGLSVHPNFRGQKLGVRLLESRTDIGRKYGLTATSTAFTAPASQIQAERAGFETVFEQDYASVLDDEGSLIFPNIKSKSVKIMIKKLN
ncbi:uncharacterized protein LOC106652526 [Trichogramma pretiosum]|uniref:uncharacterized protein LOC106652526 n=1 Tax=Trichogramma pretiosum TaxID=7493 RepID=UPI0006C953E4|nr:uncharacterized protein LOC106652526 [Trichogramma pretiosum]XP_014227017.1 uncharacterized protein LOC106652526 [Trichogramma pretiosum]